MCSGKRRYYPSEAKILEKEKLNLQLNDLIKDVQETKADLNELSNQAAEIERQNLNPSPSSL